MKVLIVIAAVCTVIYLGVSVSLKGTTACIGLSDHRACVTGSAK
jgi:hypothetical protein